MLEQKIKEVLLKKLKQLEEVKEKMSETYDKLEKLYGVYENNFNSWDNNEEWNNICGQEGKLDGEIDLILMETNYFPLSGLNDTDIKRIRSFGNLVYSAYDELKRKNIIWNEHLIDKHLDFELNRLRQDMKQRIRQVKPLLLKGTIDFSTRIFYKQITSCYIFGLFDACCVLSRAVLEGVAMKFIVSYGIKNPSVSSIEENLKKFGVSKELIETYNQIRKRANKILHSSKMHATEHDAVNSIELLYSFLTDFPGHLII